MTATLPLIALAARVTLAEGPAPLRVMLLVHVLAGAVALVTGYFALYAAKGSALHRKSGMWFVYSIVTMGALAVVINVFEGEDWGGRADRRACAGAPARHAVLGLAPAPQEARAGVAERRRERSAERVLAGVGEAKPSASVPQNSLLLSWTKPRTVES